MSTSLGDALERLAHDVPSFGDVELAVREAERRRARRRRTAVAVLALAAAAAVVLAGSVVRQDGAPQPAPPVVPGPSGQPWPASVDLEGVASSPTLEQSPLPGGAALALVVAPRAEGSGTTAVVVAGTELRRVTSGRFVLAALSPDGRYLATAAVQFGGDDFAVTDVTTGRNLASGTFRAPDGTDAQTHQLDWSADSRHLVQIWQPTVDNVDPENETARIWTIDGHVARQGPELRALPGRLVGLSPDGSQLAAESGGHVAVTSTSREAWSTTSADVPASTDVATPDHIGRGHSRWSPDGATTAWIVSRADGTTPLDIVIAATAGGTLRRASVRDGEDVLGWSGGDPLVLVRERADQVVVGTLGDDGRIVPRTTVTAPREISRVSVAQDWVPHG